MPHSACDKRTMHAPTCFLARTPAPRDTHGAPWPLQDPADSETYLRLEDGSMVQQQQASHGSWFGQLACAGPFRRASVGNGLVHARQSQQQEEEQQPGSGGAGSGGDVAGGAQNMGRRVGPGGAEGRRMCMF